MIIAGVRRPAVLVALALLASTRPAFAYRPFDGTDAEVAKRGELELEVGTLGYLHGRDGSAVAPMQVVNFGPAPRVELVLGGRPFVPAYGAAGDRLALVDTSASIKSVLREGVLQDARGPSIALELAVLLPTINGDPGWGAGAALIISERVSVLTLHLNLQLTRTRAENADGVADLIAEGPPLFADTRPVAELSLEHEFTATTTAAALVGFISQVSERFSLDAATRFAASGRDRVFEIRGGFTCDIDLLGAPEPHRDE